MFAFFFVCACVLASVNASACAHKVYLCKMFVVYSFLFVCACQCECECMCISMCICVIYDLIMCASFFSYVSVCLRMCSCE